MVGASHPLHMNFLLLMGIAIFGGTVGARIFKLIRFPQVVGYIVIGLFLGESGIRLFDGQTLEMMRPFNFFTLGIIGFMIGGELKLGVLRKYGRQFMIILLAEGLGAFAVVALLTTLVGGIMTHAWRASLGMGLLLGAISSATAPAATVDVLWELRSGGPLTKTVLAIVAMDDGLALLLYGLCSSLSSSLFGHGAASWAQSLAQPMMEMGGSILAGLVSGAVLNYAVRRLRENDNALTFTVGTVFLVIGATLVLDLDPILAAMSLGMTLVNLAPRRSNSAFELVAKFAPPIYVLFFVLVGARMKIDHMELGVVFLTAVYVIGRTAGKMLGARMGAVWAGAAESVRRYLGLCLFSQAGVAIGLSILASQQFSGPLAYVGQTVIIVVTASTFIVQLLGPPCVKWGVVKAGESNMNVTVEDLIASYRVRDVMNASPVTIAEYASLAVIWDTFSENAALCYPVVSSEGVFAGLISFQNIKDTLSKNDLQYLLVARDLMEPVREGALPDASLQETLDRMKSLAMDYLPVFEKQNSRRLVGFLDRQQVMHTVTAEILRRERHADAFG